MPRILIVDAFADRPFRGNPAAVCLLEEACDDAEWMQRLAAEMNLSETAFVAPGDSSFSLRWFTPAVEVELCGHATLASAHSLWEEASVPKSDAIAFETASGRLQACRTDDGIQLDFPNEAPRAVEPPPELDSLLGAGFGWVGANRFDLLVEVADEDGLRNLQPDLLKLAALPYRGLIVTTEGRGDYDFLSRFFGPACGVDEDPVTGSAHCCLAPFWADRLGRTRLRGYQASARGGVVTVELSGDRVLLEGQAVTVVRGECCYPGAGSP